jgi:hypothetical protein
MEGTYILKLSASDGELAAEDTVTVTVNPKPNEAPHVYAGADQMIVWPENSVNLAGIAVDDGLPNPPGAMMTLWEKISGPAEVVFADANSANTTAAFSSKGNYELKLTAGDGQYSANDTVIVQVKVVLSVDVVNPSFELDASGVPSTVKRKVDGSDGLGGVSGWLQHGTGDVGVESGASDGPMRLYSQENCGVYQFFDYPIGAGDSFTLTIDSYQNSSDNVNFAAFVYEDGGLQETGVSLQMAGPYHAWSIDNKLTFVAETGQPYIGKRIGVKITMTGTDPDPTWGGWGAADNVRLIVAPGTLAGDINGDGAVDGKDLAELAEQWLWSGTAGGIPEDMVEDGTVELSDYTVVANNWGASQGPANLPPQVDAGSDQQLEFPDNDAQLDGTVTDDGVPNPPATVTTAWEKASGPGDATFADYNAVDTSVTFSEAGIYVLRLMASDGLVGVNDIVTITVLGGPQVVSVLNPGFELDANGDPNSTKRLLNGSDGKGGVLGWLALGTGETGVEGIRSEGLMAQYSEKDCGCYQMLAHTLAEGDNFTLLFDSYRNSVANATRAEFFYDDGGTHVQIVSVVVQGTQKAWRVDNTLSYTVGAEEACIGKALGVKFTQFNNDAAHPDWGGWGSVDNVRMTVASIP